MTDAHIHLELLDACLEDRAFAWQKLVDCLLPTALQIIDGAARTRAQELAAEDREELAGAIFQYIQADDYAPLRQFDRTSSLGTYFGVLAQRVVAQRLAEMAERPGEER